jgi:hypothetical protein
MRCSHRVRAVTILLVVCIELLSHAMIAGDTEVNLYMSNTNLEIRIGYVGAKMSACGAICNTLYVVRICRLLAFVIQRKETTEVCFS